MKGGIGMKKKKKKNNLKKSNCSAKSSVAIEMCEKLA